MRTYLLALVLFFTEVSVAEDLKLNPVRPEESAEETFSRTLHISAALDSLNTLKEALVSFRKLTETARLSIPPEKLKEIGYTEWDMQNIGFRNLPQIIEGTLLKEEYLLKTSELEAAKIKFERKEITEEKFLEAQSAAKQAKEQFLLFWETFRLTD